MTGGNQHILHENESRAYFFMLPNLYDDADLTVYEFRLLAHYVRVGVCWEATRTTAKHCHIAASSVVKARRGLEAKGFVTLGVSADETVEVVVLDKWKENTGVYGGPAKSRSPDERSRSPQKRSRSPDTPARSPDSLKEDSIKKTPLRREAAANSRPPSVELCKRILYRFPHKSVWPSLDRRVGREFPRLLRWGRILRRWKLNNWNPTAWEKMLKVYDDGWDNEQDAGSYSAAADVRAFNRSKGEKI